MTKIIYPIDGKVAVVFPTGELPVDQVALKDVPAGLPFLIVDDADVPEDFSFSDAWVADFSNPDGHGIGHDAWAAQQAAALAQLRESQAPKESQDVDHD
ncbi:hypothetical protein [Afipia felis]|uniref:Uncharacterized protein n=2 Tax=Afipia felis TaxID=1035 RepID=A0A381AYR5_AFIFE|nr:hypothetical protein [Afipia felis]EKS26736.1 hypothetical protein HMPREF9697_03994 [Afipia felis ATCC 53690]SUU76177.1 Uncharacterised protein [Afipia felis]SUU84244.1 Uncharacterised protein [Afipia felis]SUW28262.1 Uncharacterised protein [Afipia felis]